MYLLMSSSFCALVSGKSIPPFYRKFKVQSAKCKVPISNLQSPIPIPNKKPRPSEDRRGVMRVCITVTPPRQAPKNGN